MRLKGFINRVGIELEGAWRVDAPPQTRVYGDGSVHIEQRYSGTYDAPQLLIGEICSEPITPEEGLTWIARNFPYNSNHSCGMHVHISFRNQLRYAQLMDPTFWVYFRKVYGEWAHGNISQTSPFWPRWNGGNRFCLLSWIPDQQVPHASKGGNRYTLLNYAWGVRAISNNVIQDWNRLPREPDIPPRKTLECRLFPIFESSALAVMATRRFFEVVNEFLRKRNPEEHYTASLTEDGKDAEEIVECA